jgi:hypothetical protein
MMEKSDRSCMKNNRPRLEEVTCNAITPPQYIHHISMFGCTYNSFFITLLLRQIVACFYMSVFCILVKVTRGIKTPVPKSSYNFCMSC